MSLADQLKDQRLASHAEKDIASINYYKAQLNYIIKLKTVTDEKVRELQEENEALKKVNRGLILTTQQQHERLKRHEDEVSTAPIDSVEPIVDPIATVNTMKKLRMRNAELTEALRDYELQEQSRKNDVLELRTLQFSLEKAMEDRDSAVSTDAQTKTLYRINQELLKNFELQKALNRSLRFPMDRTTSETANKASQKTEALPESGTDDANTETLKECEEVIQTLKTRNASLQNIVHEMTNEIKRLRLMLNVDKAGKHSVNQIQENFIFEARMEELNQRVAATDLRVKNKELNSRVKSLNLEIKELEAVKEHMQKELEMTKAERDSTSKRLASQKADEQNRIYLSVSGVINIRGDQAQAQVGTLGDMYSMRPVSSSSSSIARIARAPGIMSTGPTTTYRQRFPDSELGLRARGSRLPDTTFQTHSTHQHMKNAAPRPDILQCPNCYKRFPNDRLKELQDHVDHCLK